MARWTETQTPSGFLIRVPGYVLRDHSLFTDENDHNPDVAKLCPECNGNPRFFTEYTDANGQRVHADGACAKCSGRGVFDESGGSFSNNQPDVTIRLNAAGYIKCPGCGKHFTFRDPNVWTGRRHICGQKIMIAATTNATEPSIEPKPTAQSN